MARTAKTNHVMSLVGEKSKRTASSKNEGNSQKEKNAALKPTNPALLPIEKELRFAQPKYSDSAADIHTLSSDSGEQSDSTAVHYSNGKGGQNDWAEMHYSDDKDEQNDWAEMHYSDDKDKQADTAAAGDFSDKAEQAPSSDIKNREKAEQGKETAAEKEKEQITAVVPELINQELDAIVKRFRISPTDNNLWQLTKAALEAIRPEFSLNGEDYREKCGRLRQKVILEMTKAAIKISKANRK